LTDRPTTLTPLPRERLVSLLFFASGAAGLIFEVAWFHRCTLVFGSTVWATSLVVASFMAGVAIGTACVVWAGHRIVRFFTAYAALEMVVAVSGVVLTLELPDLTTLFNSIMRHVGGSEWLVNLLRFGMAFTAMAIPTTAMGATLPVLVAGLARRGQSFGRVLGHLYGWNTMGAVAGVLTGEIVLISQLGVAGSAWFAGLLDLGAAAIAWRLSARFEAGDAAAAARSKSSRRPGWSRVACAFLAGANLMALELLWFRFLLMFVVNSTLALSLILAVVLGAIALGGFTASRWLARCSHATMYLPALAVTAGTLSVASYIAFQLTHGAWAIEWYWILWFALVLTGSTSFLSGVFFTVLGEAIKHTVGADTQAAGWLGLSNTAGAMGGPLVATFVLVPCLGMELGFFIVAASYGVVGLLALPESAGRRRGKLGLAIAASAWGVALATFPFGLMRKTFVERSVSAYTADGSGIVAVREAPDETVLLLQQTWLGRPIYHRLVTNGFSMSGTHTTGLRYMRLFAYWPMLLHEAPLRRALVLCYGVGVTAGAVTDIDALTSIDVVEISRDIVAMSDLIYPPALRPLHDRRVQLHIEDARMFLERTDQRYDLITGEPPPPLAPGAVNLYTRDYFSLVRDRLAEGGIATYWLPIAGDGAYDVAPIVRAFCDVFDDCSLWNGTLFDWMLVGTRHASGPVREESFAAKWRNAVLAARLEEVGFEVPAQIGAAFLGDAPYLHQLTTDTQPLSDDHPQRLLPPMARRLLLLNVPQGPNPEFMRVFRDVIDPGRARAAFKTSDFIRRLWPSSLAAQTLPFFDAQRIINRVMWEGANPLRYIEELHRLLMNGALERLPLWSMGSNDALQRAADAGGASQDASGMVEYQHGLHALSTRQYAAAAADLAAADRLGLGAPTLRPLLAYAFCRAGQIDAAKRLLARNAPSRNADERHFWSWLTSTFHLMETPD
jgi:spermidine synthase